MFSVEVCIVRVENMRLHGLLLVVVERVPT